jgi:hypothetical protein
MDKRLSHLDTGESRAVGGYDGRADRAASRTSQSSQSMRPASVLQAQAWQWAVANRTPTGKLPSGRQIAQQFGRRERWGRLVKQAGLANRLDPTAAM